MTDQRTFRGIDLISKIIEFIRMTPDPKEWNLSSLKSNPPRYILFQQINSLISAFLKKKTETPLLKDNPDLTIKSVLSGDFINQQKIEDYEKTYQFITHFVIEHGTRVYEPSTYGFSLYDLGSAFRFLIDYKRQLTSLIRFNSGWLAVSGRIDPLSFTMVLTNSISDNLYDKYSDLDKALELFTNPKGLSFTEEELIAKYNYPTENLFDVNFEWA